MSLGCRTADEDWGNWTPEGQKKEQNHDEHWLAQGWTQAQIGSWKETRRAKAKKKRDREKEKKHETWERNMMFKHDPREVWVVVPVEEANPASLLATASSNLSCFYWRQLLG